MFISMTGFGSSEHNFSWGKIKVEASSINHKYQDFSVKLPRELFSLENRIINLLRNSITRGKVKISVDITYSPLSNIPVIDEQTIMNIYTQIKDISERNNLEFPKDITQILAIPGILDTKANSAEQAAHEDLELWDKIFNNAIDSLISMKKSEGAKLFARVQEDINFLADLVKELAKRWEISQSEAIEALRARIENVMQYYNLELDQNRIAQEVSLMSDKWDVSEEITRMDSHIEKFMQILNEKESQGKKLDFLIQEMNREINTMGSKVADADFRWKIVEAKSCIEKIREQIQNIE